MHKRLIKYEKINNPVINIRITTEAAPVISLDLMANAKGQKTINEIIIGHFIVDTIESFLSLNKYSIFKYLINFLNVM